MSVDLTCILGTLSRSILAEAVHRAMRTINYRDGADNMIAGLQLDAPADEAAEAALVTLRSIEHEENRPISDLSDEQATKYVRGLSTLLEERFKKELELDETEGSQKLEELRALEP